MEVKIYNSEEISLIKNEWKELHIRDENAMFYNSYEFVSIMSKHILNDNSIIIIVVKEGKALLGLSVLCKKKSSVRYLKKEISTFIEGVDFGDMLIDSTYKNPISVVKKLYSQLDVLTENRICLKKIPDNSVLLWYLLKNKEYNKYCTVRSEFPYIDINYWSDFIEYKKQCLPKNVNKFRNKLFKDKEYQFVCLRGSDIPFDEIVGLHVDRTKESSRGDSMFLSKGDLYRELMSLENSYCFCIMVENKIQGYISAFFSNGTLHNWNTAHNPVYDNYRIGRILCHDQLEYVFNEFKSVTNIDFGGGRYPWKFELTPHSRLTYEFRFNKRHKKLFNFIDSLEFGLRGFFKK
jgi:hypothetical protein